MHRTEEDSDWDCEMFNNKDLTCENEKGNLTLLRLLSEYIYFRSLIDKKKKNILTKIIKINILT